MRSDTRSPSFPTSKLPLVISTDSKSGMQSIDRVLIGTSRRLRLGCRAMVRTVRHIIAIRRNFGGMTTFVHVKSHTEGSDVMSRGNSAADIDAGDAALDEAYDRDRCSAFLVGEEDVVFWEIKSNVLGNKYDFHISGDLRHTLKRLHVDG